jgi:L-lysine exporter family protein LysE/ArgO
MFLAYVQGMAVGAGLIIAIGAQNAFVLTQGIRRQHHLLVAAICFSCDTVLIVVGVAGVGRAVAGRPLLQLAAAWAGAVFLFAYGARALSAAMATNALKANRGRPASLQEVVATTLAVTLLNPHVYLDTVLLLGGISSQFAHEERFFFALGACSASCLWFFSLSIGGTLLAPIFAKPGAWRLLDLFVCGSMWTVAVLILPV